MLVQKTTLTEMAYTRIRTDVKMGDQTDMLSLPTSNSLRCNV